MTAAVLFGLSAFVGGCDSSSSLGPCTYRVVRQVSGTGRVVALTATGPTWSRSMARAVWGPNDAVFSVSRGRLQVRSKQKGRVQASVPLCQDAAGLVLIGGGHELAVLCPEEREVRLFTTDGLREEVPLEICSRPSALASDGTGHRLYVGCPEGIQIAVSWQAPGRPSAEGALMAQTDDGRVHVYSLDGVPRGVVNPADNAAWKVQTSGWVEDPTGHGLVSLTRYLTVQGNPEVQGDDRVAVDVEIEHFDLESQQRTSQQLSMRADFWAQWEDAPGTPVFDQSLQYLVVPWGSRVLIFSRLLLNHQREAFRGKAAASGLQWFQAAHPLAAILATDEPGTFLLLPKNGGPWSLLTVGFRGGPKEQIL